MHATASRVTRWLVVEQPGPWGHDALLDSRMDTTVARALHGGARHHRVRVLLARRPGWQHDEGPRRVHLARTTPDGGWLEQLEVEHESELLRIDLKLLRRNASPGIGQPVTGPLLLVCTHGRHDQCCANLGRPVARALAAAGVPDVWEASHVGGDRFAANVVALPWGVYLGRVPPERAPAVVAELAAGRIDLDLYRGRSCFSTLVQAAEIAARRHLDERQLDGIVVEEAGSIGEETVRVRFRSGSRSLVVVVHRRPGPPEHLTCSDAIGRPWLYEVLSIE